MPRRFRPYSLDQQLLLPPNLRDWVGEGHLSLYVSDVVDQLDLSAITRDYEKGDPRGGMPYDPAMMVKLLVYSYAIGMPSSRRIERATYDDVATRVLTCDQHPDHDSIAAFRKRHLKALAKLFVQVLKLCQRAGLVKLGHVALDGTKIQANASKHKAMSYGRMPETERRLEREVRDLLSRAEARDAIDDREFGKGVRGDELPAELARRESRLKKLREAKASLEAEAREEAESEGESARAKIAAREEKAERTGKRVSGPVPKVPDPEQAVPDSKAQRNFTDPDSRIMLDGATKQFVQGYNVQAAVDSHAQVIVATGLTQAANDVKQLVPMFNKVKENVGRLPAVASADAGYFSEANVTASELEGMDLYVPPDRSKHDAKPDSESIAGTEQSVKERMRDKVRSEAGHELYKMRKAIVEPVFGQTKEVRRFRRFSFRGFENVTAEWDLICLTHNVLKLFRAGAQLAYS
jgi:transposase